MASTRTSLVAQLTDDQVQRIIHDYRTTPRSTRVMAPEYGISSTGLLGLLRRHGVTIRTPRESRRRCSLNERAFENLTAPALYWLGFLMGDGYVGGREVGVTLAACDRDHLEQFRTFLGSTHAIRDTPTRSPRRTAVCRFTFKSPVIVERLTALGITPRKTQTAAAHPSLLGRRDFWRGVVDADGHVGRHGGSARLHVAGSLALMTQFRDVLAPIVGRSSTVSRLRNIYQIQFCGPRAVAAIRWLYHDASVALTRKALRAQEITSAPVIASMSENRPMTKKSKNKLKTKEKHLRNPAAVALGRLGGQKRAQTVLQTISPAKRTMYARHAALARWAQVRAAKEHPPE